MRIDFLIKTDSVGLEHSIKQYPCCSSVSFFGNTITSSSVVFLSIIHIICHRNFNSGTWGIQLENLIEKALSMRVWATCLACRTQRNQAGIGFKFSPCWLALTMPKALFRLLGRVFINSISQLWALCVKIPICQVR